MSRQGSQSGSDEEELAYIPRDKRRRVDLGSLRAAVMHRSIVAEREEKFARAGLSLKALEEMDPRYEQAARDRAEQAAKVAKEREVEAKAKAKECVERQSEMAGFRPGEAPQGSLYKRFIRDESIGQMGRSRSRSGSPPIQQKSSGSTATGAPLQASATKVGVITTEGASTTARNATERPEHFAPRKQGNHIGAPTTGEIKRFNRTLLSNAVMEVHPSSHARLEGRRVMPPPEQRR